MKNFKEAPALLVFGFLLVAGCSSGGSDSGSSDPGLLDPEQQFQGADAPANTTGFNGGLTGRIIGTVGGRPAQYDLTTGEVKHLQPMDLEKWMTEVRGTPPHSGSGYFETGGESAGGLYMQTLPVCHLYETYMGREYYHSCIGIYGADYSLIEYVWFGDPVSLRMPPKLSPSGKYVARNFVYRHICCNSNLSRIILTDLDERADTKSIDLDIESRGSRGDSPLEWLPDDRLVYSIPSDYRPKIYITKPESLDTAEIISLPDGYRGKVKSLSPSPDGTKLLMEYSDRYGGSSVLLLDLETLILSEPAIDPRDVSKEPVYDDMRGVVYAPRWSPDGQWIMMISGRGSTTIGHSPVYAGVVDFAARTWPTLYAVPASKKRTLLTQEEPTDAIAIKLVRPGRESSGPDYNWYGGAYYEWLE